MSLTGRTARKYFRKDNKKPVSDEEIYHMLMLYKYQRKSLNQIARQFSLEVSEVRTIIGRRSGGSCCG
jgi:hypothetical protein